MSYRGSYNANRSLRKGKRPVNTGSSAVASDAHVRHFYNNLSVLFFDSAVEYSTSLGTTQNNYISRYVYFEEQNWQALVAAATTGINGAAAIADPTLPKPIWMEQGHYDMINAMYGPAGTAGTYIANSIAGAPTFLPIRKEVPKIEIPQEDFDYAFKQILYALAHSGAPSTGTLKQVVDFIILDTPAAPDAIPIELERVREALPPGITFMNIMNKHANLIAKEAQRDNVSFEWGKKHGAGDVPGHIAFASWSYITEVTISQDHKEILRCASAAAIRDKQKAIFEDPNALLQPEEESSLHAAEELARINASTRHQTVRTLAPNFLLRQEKQRQQPSRSRDED